MWQIVSYSLPTIFCKWLIWIGINSGVSWHHIWEVVFQWKCFFPLPFIKVEFNVKLVHNLAYITWFHAILLYKSNILYFVFDYCLVSVLLARVTDQIFYIYCKASLNIRTILIIFCQYFYGNSIFNVSFNVYLFKRAIFDVMLQGRSESTSSVAFEVLIINFQIYFINLFILNC